MKIEDFSLSSLPKYSFLPQCDGGCTHTSVGIIFLCLWFFLTFVEHFLILYRRTIIIVETMRVPAATQVRLFQSISISVYYVRAEFASQIVPQYNLCICVHLKRNLKISKIFLYKIFRIVRSKSFVVTNQMSHKFPRGGTQQNFIWGGSAGLSPTFYIPSSLSEIRGYSH